MERYTNLATQASVIAGFSFESLVELEVPEGTHWARAGMYFIFGSMAMALALYCLVVASFACVFGHRLALGRLLESDRLRLGQERKLLEHGEENVDYRCRKHVF